MKFDRVRFTGNDTIKNVKKEVSLSKNGDLSVGDNIIRWKAKENINLQSMKVRLGSAPTGSDVILDIKRNGTVMSTASVIQGTSSYDLVMNQNIDKNDIISIDVTQVGSTISGSRLVVQFTHTNI